MEFGFGGEKCLTAGNTPVGARFIVVVINAGEGRLGAFFSEDVVLGAGEFLLPKFS